MAKRTVREQLEREWQELLASLPAERIREPRWLREGGSMAGARPAALFAELEDVRRSWMELRASRQLEKNASRFVTPRWTLKDLLGHLASWAQEFRQEAEKAARGEAFDYAIPYAFSVLGPNQWNQVQVEKRRSQPLREILREFESETRCLQELVLELPEESLQAETFLPWAPTGNPAALFRGNAALVVMAKCMHDRHHLGRIRQWLANLSP